MNKITFSIIIILFACTLNTHSKTWVIKSTNYSFEPSTLTVAVGDTIVWKWEKGRHSTTSAEIPAGAKSWDADLDSSNPTFTYVITVPGVYNYICTPHETSDNMVGTITAK